MRSHLISAVLSRDHFMIIHVISACAFSESVHDLSRDLCMISHMISV